MVQAFVYYEQVYHLESERELENRISLSIYDLQCTFKCLAEASLMLSFYFGGSRGRFGCDFGRQGAWW